MSDPAALPAGVLDRVAATLRGIVDTPEVESFLVGSSAAPATESAGLGADAVVDLFRSDVASEVAAIRAGLEATFAAHPKARALSIDDPLAAPRGAVTHVYLALWAVADIAAPPA